MTRPVEQRHREAADEALCGAEVLFQGEYDEALDRVAQALANAEHPAPSSEGGFDPWEALLKHSADSDPERAGNGPIVCLVHEGDDDDFEHPASVWLMDGSTAGEGKTARAAALDLCRKLGLTSADQAKGDADG